MARGNYRFHATQEHPMVMIPEPIYARFVIAGEEIGLAPGMCVEQACKEWLIRHGQGMEDGAFEAINRKAEAEMRPSMHRHEFNKGRKRRPTDPK